MYEDSSDNFTTRVDYLAALGKSIVPLAFYFANKEIAFTGRDPFEVEDLLRLLPAAVRAYDDIHISNHPRAEIVVVGQTGFNRALINECIRNSDKPPRFLPQEGFVDELLFGHDWWYEDVELLDAVTKYHPGLRYVQSLETFRWPSTEAPETIGTKSSGISYRDQTPLYKLGYRKVTETRPSERWLILTTKALPELGLEEVAKTIASHCRRYKRQRGGREKYANAIREWEYDLRRLKQEYYDIAHNAQFHWPSTEPSKTRY